MKKLLFLLLSLASFSLEATHFQSSMAVTPLNNTNEYLVEVHIEKIIDINSPPELIVSPKIICTVGEPAQVTIGSEDKADFLSIQVMMPTQNDVHASILVQEKDQVVLSFDNVIKLNHSSL